MSQEQVEQVEQHEAQQEDQSGNSNKKRKASQDNILDQSTEQQQAKKQRQIIDIQKELEKDNSKEDEAEEERVTGMVRQMRQKADARKSNQAEASGSRKTPTRQATLDEQPKRRQENMPIKVYNQPMLDYKIYNNLVVGQAQADEMIQLISDSSKKRLELIVTGIEEIKGIEVPIFTIHGKKEDFNESDALFRRFCNLNVPSKLNAQITAYKLIQ